LSFHDFPALVVAKVAKTDKSLTDLVDNLGYGLCGYRAHRD
jgi:hypothetical protein